MPENMHCTNEKSSILEKLKEHKKEIIVISAVVCTTIAGILVYQKLTPKQINALQELAEHSSELNKFPIIQEASRYTKSTAYNIEPICNQSVTAGSDCHEAQLFPRN